MTPTPRFHEEQRLLAPWLAAIVLVAALLPWALFVAQVVLGRPLGGHPMPLPALLVLWVGVGIVMPLVLGLARLVTDAGEDGLSLRFVPLARRRIPTSAIRAAEVVRYRPILEYGGWGLRWTPWRGAAWNARGDRGVRLHLVDGRTFLVGSQRPEALAAALGRPAPGTDA